MEIRVMNEARIDPLHLYKWLYQQEILIHTGQLSLQANPISHLEALMKDPNRHLISFRSKKPNTNRGSTGHSFPWKSIWGARVPWKVTLFVWTVTGEKYWQLISSVRSTFWKLIGVVYIGVGNHLRQISGLLFLHFWIVWVMQKSVIELRKVDKEDSNAIGLQRSGKL